jgi:hypothetical protein
MSGGKNGAVCPVLAAFKKHEMKLSNSCAVVAKHRNDWELLTRRCLRARGTGEVESEQRITIRHPQDEG